MKKSFLSILAIFSLYSSVELIAQESVPNPAVIDVPEKTSEDMKKNKRQYDVVEEQRIETDDEVIIITKKRKNIRLPEGGEVKRKFNSFWDNLPSKAYKIDDYVMDQIHGRVKKDSMILVDFEVYRNNPHNGLVNVKFFSMSKEPIVIKILDIDGNTVQTNQIDNFEGGEFLTQIKIDEKLKGNFIIIVKQNGIAETETISF